jgi:iron complex transport system ATP-binding protein
LLKALAGLIKPDSGKVMLDARSLDRSRIASLAARRAYLPQNPHLEWPLSVERLVALGLTPQLPATGGLPESFAPPSPRAGAMRLVDKSAQPATTLSGGSSPAPCWRAPLSATRTVDCGRAHHRSGSQTCDPIHAALSTIARSGTLVIASLHDLTWRRAIPAGS